MVDYFFTWGIHSYNRADITNRRNVPRGSCLVGRGCLENPQLRLALRLASLPWWSGLFPGTRIYDSCPFEAECVVAGGTRVGNLPQVQQQSLPGRESSDAVGCFFLRGAGSLPGSLRFPHLALVPTALSLVDMFLLFR